MEARERMNLQVERFEDFSHTGPGTPAGRLMRSFWQPVGLSDELQAGRTRPIQVMGEEYTLYRGESGKAYVVAGRCAHRGTQLSVGWVEGDCIRCLYHGWKYDESGQCVEQAIEDPTFASKVRIAAFPVHEYLGLIFAYLGDGEPPEPPRYPEYESGVVTNPVTMRVPYNFFQNMENSVDTLHVSWVHRYSNFFADSRSSDFGNGKGAGTVGIEGTITECWAEETEYGFVFYDAFGPGKIKTSFFEIPNILHINIYPLDAESGWRDFLAWKVPIDDNSYSNFNLTIAHVQGEAAERYRAHPQNPQNLKNSETWAEVCRLGEEILAGRLRLTLEDCGELARSVNLQDYVVQRGQGVSANREHERLGQSDKVVLMLRKLWSREMAKLTHGEPLKKWHWPGYLELKTGLD